MMPTTTEANVTVSKSNSIRPSLRSVSWKVCRAPTPPEVNGGTRSQVTTKRSEVANVVMGVPTRLGSRSEKNGAIRGGPLTARDNDRALLDASGSTNVAFPSEWTKI